MLASLPDTFRDHLLIERIEDQRKFKRFKAFDFIVDGEDLVLLKQLRVTGQSFSGEDTEHFGRFRLPLARCLFFRDTRRNCTDHEEDSCMDKDCLKKSLRDLFDLIRAAQTEILLACYTFHYSHLADVILEAHERNVKVRVIANFDSISSDCDLMRFSEKGIRIRTKQTTYIFHHKFIILDGKVLINGSTNFTQKGIFGNVDSLIVTSDPFFVKEYEKEFNYLWKSLPLTY